MEVLHAEETEVGQGRKDRGGGGAEEWTEVEVLHAEETEVGQGRKDRDEVVQRNGQRWRCCMQRRLRWDKGGRTEVETGDGAKETEVGGPFLKGSS